MNMFMLLLLLMVKFIFSVVWKVCLVFFIVGVGFDFFGM